MIASILGFLAIIVGIGAVIALVVWGLFRGVSFIRTSNASLKSVTRSNESMVCDLRQVAAACADETLNARIQATAERLRFSDSAIAMPGDGNLRQEIVRLSHAISADDSTTAAETLAAIEQLVKERNAAVALERRGSF